MWPIFAALAEPSGAALWFSGGLWQSDLSVARGRSHSCMKKLGRAAPGAGCVRDREAILVGHSDGDNCADTDGWTRDVEFAG